MTNVQLPNGTKIEDISDELLERYIFGTQKVSEEKEELSADKDKEEETEKVSEKKFKKRILNGPISKSWSDADIQILKKGYVKRRIAWGYLTKHLKRSKSAIRKYAWFLGLTKERRNKYYNGKQKSGQKHFLVGPINKWSAEEVDILKKGYCDKGGIDWKYLEENLPKRTKTAIRVYANKLELKTNTWPKRYSRRQYISKRIKLYSKMGFPPMQAEMAADNDWKKFVARGKQKAFEKGVGSQKIITEKMEGKTCDMLFPFPEFKTISSDLAVILKGMVKNLLANGGKMTYPECKEVLDIENGRCYHDFVAEFMFKSEEICVYFGVENRFRHERVMDKYDIIVYDCKR